MEGVNPIYADALVDLVSVGLKEWHFSTSEIQESAAAVLFQVSPVLRSNKIGNEA